MRYEILADSLNIGNNILRKGDIVTALRLRHIDNLLANGSIVTIKTDNSPSQNKYFRNPSVNESSPKHDFNGEIEGE